MNSPNPISDFEQKSQTKPPGFLAEFFDFLLHNKKWWLAPILVVLLLVSVLIVLTSNVLMPFIYPIMADVNSTVLLRR